MKRKMFCGILFLSVAFTAFAQSERDFELGFLRSSQSIVIIGYHGTAIQVNIPARMNFNGQQFPVTQIGTSRGNHSGVMARKSLTSVVIPNTVILIGDGAFMQNPLTRLVIGSSVERIAFRAFADNRLINVTIPNSVISIGEEAFRSNTITSITIGADVSVNETAFRGNFTEVYNANGRRAGTYTYSDDQWRVN